MISKARGEAGFEIKTQHHFIGVLYGDWRVDYKHSYMLLLSVPARYLFDTFCIRNSNTRLSAAFIIVKSTCVAKLSLKIVRKKL